MESQDARAVGGRAVSWIGLSACIGVILGWVLQRLVPLGPDAGQVVGAPDLLPVVAAAFAAVGLMPLDDPVRRLRARRAVRWIGLLLMVWLANGLLFDLLTLAGLMGHRNASGAIVMSSVYWPGLVTRTFAFVALLALARLALAAPSATAGAPSARPAVWYGYAAFVLALPYPLLRLHWALGGTLGLLSPGAAGRGWEPLVIAIPWMAAAVLSLLLVSPPGWMPRRLLLAAGWSATAVVATIGPAAFGAFLSEVASGSFTTGDIEVWVFGLFYTSWFLWAIAGGAATRSYQLRTAGPPAPSPV